MIEVLIGYLIALVGWIASFYLWSQWLVYPKLRRRFQVCKPFPAVGWGMWLVGGSIIEPVSKLQHSNALQAGGALVAIVGISLIVYASIRLLRSNAAQRKAVRSANTSVPSTSQPEGTWPPPPNLPYV